MIQQYSENMEQWESLANLSGKLIQEGKKGHITKKETIKLYFGPIKLFNLSASFRMGISDCAAAGRRTGLGREDSST